MKTDSKNTGTETLSMMEYQGSIAMGIKLHTKLWKLQTH